MPRRDFVHCERLYELLGTTKDNFNIDTARKYRRSLMVAIHPDHCNFEYAHLMSTMVNFAFDVLSDNNRKTYYDKNAQPSSGEEIDQDSLSKALFHLKFAIAAYNKANPQKMVGPESSRRLTRESSPILNPTNNPNRGEPDDSTINAEDHYQKDPEPTSSGEANADSNSSERKEEEDSRNKENDSSFFTQFDSADGSKENPYTVSSPEWSESSCDANPNDSNLNNSEEAQTSGDDGVKSTKDMACSPIKFSTRVFKDAACSPNKFSTRDAACSPIQWDQADNSNSEMDIDDVSMNNTSAGASNFDSMEVDSENMASRDSSASRPPPFTSTPSASSNKRVFRPRPGAKVFSWITKSPHKVYIEKIVNFRVRGDSKTFRVIWGPKRIPETVDKSVVMEEGRALTLWLRSMRDSSKYRSFSSIMKHHPEFADFI